MKASQVSDQQLWTAVVGIMLIKAFRTLPRAIALTTTTAAPWAILIVGITALLLFWPVAALLSRRPGQNLIDLSLEAGGRPLAIITALFVGAYLIINAGLSLRETSEMVVTALYPHTPQTFAMTALLLTGALGARMVPAGAIRLGTLFTWPTVAGILLVLVGNLGWGKFQRLLPLTGPGVLPVLGEVLPLTSNYGELVYLAVFSGYLTTSRSLKQAAALAVGIPGAMWAAVFMVCFMVFPLPGGLAIPFPLFALTRLVQGGRFMERVDALWLVSWTLGAGIHLMAALMGTALLYRDAFRLPDHRGAVLPLAVIVLTVALIPSNQHDVIATQAYLIGRWGYLPALGLPLVIALVVLLRQSRARLKNRGGIRA